jgi:hypothetical protein
MKKFMTILLVPVLAGCLGSGPKPAVNWTIEADSDAKVASATVCAPYGGQRIAVLRPDGSIAFDAFNAFAAAPGLIIKDALVGRRGEGSLVVRRIALDCRSAGRRNALVELELTVGGATGKGSASEPTPDGNYTAAFSRAFAEALARAREGLASEK